MRVTSVLPTGPLSRSIVFPDRPPASHSDLPFLKELLYLLMGYEGPRVYFHDSFRQNDEESRLKGPALVISRSIDPEERELTKQILRPVKPAIVLRAFVDSYSRLSYGRVNQALCAALRDILKDFTLLLSQLEEESESLDLHSLLVNVQPATMTILHAYNLILQIMDYSAGKGHPRVPDPPEFLKGVEIDPSLAALLGQQNNAINSIPSIAKGGAVLRIISSCRSTHAGDPAAIELYSLLLEKASKPYMAMLHKWLCYGIIDDPYHEFMIRELASINRSSIDSDYTDEYWEKRYSLISYHIPIELDSSNLATMALLAGKYLNVIRESSSNDFSSPTPSYIYECSPPESILSPLYSYIDSAYSHANKLLLSTLIVTYKLPERLNAMRRYFFLTNGDYITSFLESAAHELSKPVEYVSLPALQPLLDLVLCQPGTPAAADIYKEDVLVHLSKSNLSDLLLKIINITGMDTEVFTDPAGVSDSKSVASNEEEPKNSLRGIDVLELDFNVPFPVSLVISRNTRLRYQCLFRHLLAMKHIETELSEVWKDQMKSAGWTQSKVMTSWKRNAYVLRKRMLLCVQSIMYYCVHDVMEHYCSVLDNQLKSATTVDQLMDNHVTFLDSCLKDCMLTNAKLVKLQSKIVAVCLSFTSLMAHATRMLVTVDPQLAELAGKPYDASRIPKLESSLLNKIEAFDHYLGNMINALNYFAASESPVLFTLCSRLEHCLVSESALGF
ncbi:hypothetical protein CANCADRAFT_128757 [Tortispora caseinolytica NRRL Y-17796]|uniref:Spindle pole body component n=1 Tax=Tortispora caseinolytica NRRL Y-17796 TaxID=767744 RepID=A0A1E4TAL1_9ASCO|nr:hypothetical protein CANCADRAFT_128757 [Tortispora caseinolytica NRRL Y-17796]